MATWLHAAAFRMPARSRKKRPPGTTTGSALRREIASLHRRSEEILLRLAELTRELERIEDLRTRAATPKK
jgi:hypothetical protein